MGFHKARPACLFLLRGRRPAVRYRRYQIETAPAPNIAPHPHRFTVEINRVELAKLLLREMVEFRGDLGVVLSRPCVYGVFSGPLGGFLPRHEHCVGCLRCTVQYPKVAQIHRNPKRLELGDSYFGPDVVDTVLYEAATGRVPVRGAGYGGGFGGAGWDSMWTDMSEIVRPTRDGIHGREYISTAVELGTKPRSLPVDAAGNLLGEFPPTLRLPIPLLFDPVPLADPRPAQAARAAAAQLGTQALLPFGETEAGGGLQGVAISLPPEQVGALLESGTTPQLIVLDRWDRAAFERLKAAQPNTVVGTRHPLGGAMAPLVEAGAELIHLLSDYHGQSEAGFAMDAIRAAHQELVEHGSREQVSLVGGGGIIAAEHVPKAIIAGLDAVTLDTALLVALQGRFIGECRERDGARVELPGFPLEWAVQRIVNLVASWRDQLLEILGAMGLREVRRLRGEVGRAMLQAELEREAFGDILGFDG